MGESSAVEPVIDILENTDDRTLYFEAARTLLKIGSIRSLKVINLILKYKGKYQKCRIISMTGDIKRDYASDLAIEALEDSDWGVRWTAVKALAHKRGYRIKEALINTLKDVDFNVRKAAEDALNQFKLT
jgi:HEAT repeat protein